MTKNKFAITVVLAALIITSAWAAQDTPKKAYVIVHVDISNPQQYGEYMKVTPGLIEQFGGRFIARGGRSVTLEGPPARARAVIVEFPSFERAQEFYNSPEYVEARKLRAGAATAQFVLVEGS